MQNTLPYPVPGGWAQHLARVPRRNATRLGPLQPRLFMSLRRGHCWVWPQRAGLARTNPDLRWHPTLRAVPWPCPGPQHGHPAPGSPPSPGSTRGTLCRYLLGAEARLHGHLGPCPQQAEQGQRQAGQQHHRPGSEGWMRAGEHARTWLSRTHLYSPRHRQHPLPAPALCNRLHKRRERLCPC